MTRLTASGFLISLAAACGGDPPTDVPRDIPPIGRRATFDRPAEVTGRQIHVIYLLPSDGIDRGYDTTGILAHSVALFQNWLAARTGMWLRQDTWNGYLDISFVRSSRSDAANAAYGTRLLSRLYAEIRLAGFDTFNTRYLIYYEGSNPLTCGNAMQDGPVAAVYLRGKVGGNSCGGGISLRLGMVPDYWEFAMLHEVMHTLGIVDPAAPNHYEAEPWHVQDPADLMHTGGFWSPTMIDRDNDDYYGPAVPAGVRNLMNDPILVPAPDLTIARSGAGDIGSPLPRFVHHVLEPGKP